MKKLLVYSHDTYGLGNIRRMLSICKHLIDTMPDISILVVSGSPMVHSFRIPQRLDYIKLPCLKRTEKEGYSVKYLGTDIDETMRLRSEVVLSAVTHFKPDLFLVDKKPFGVKNELKGVLRYLKFHLPETKQVLLLRDILDKPEATIKIWEKNRYYDAVRSFYDLVLVVGSPEVLDIRSEYRFPPSVYDKVQFCGYIKKEGGGKSRSDLRTELRVDGERLILVTPGGGEDGYRLIKTYIAGLEWMPQGHNTRSVIICGPEMPEAQRKKLYEETAPYPHVSISEFTDDLIGYMDAADLVISMGGYNTVCEILSLQKKAVVVPRVKPVEEQWIRAERMARLGFFKTIHPDLLAPRSLMTAVMDELSAKKRSPAQLPELDLGALPRIACWVSRLLSNDHGDLKDRDHQQQCACHSVVSKNRAAFLQAVPGR